MEQPGKRPGKEINQVFFLETPNIVSQVLGLRPFGVAKILKKNRIFIIPKKIGLL
jgi:hypothetical protein